MIIQIAPTPTRRRVPETVEWFTSQIPQVDTHAELAALETALWNANTRGDREWMSEILSPTFTEFGRSGRVYTRDDSLSVSVPDHIEIELPLVPLFGEDA